MNRPVYYEIPAADPEKLATFYADVFGWKKQKWEGSVNYWMLETGPCDKGGMDLGITEKAFLSCTCNTIDVDDIDAYAKVAEELGGKIYRPKTHTPGMGYFIWITDPDDNLFVMMQSEMTCAVTSDMSLEDAMRNRPVHFEIPASNPAELALFYNSLFGWEAQIWGDEEYYLLRTGSNNEIGVNGGITRKSSFPCCVNTIGIDNIDEFLQKVQEHGGSIAVPKGHIPEVGYLAYCRDPDGNQFGLMESEMPLMP
jgi:predicted enzyme related to lactoylglutathione lyase